MLKQQRNDKGIWQFQQVAKLQAELQTTAKVIPLSSTVLCSKGIYLVFNAHFQDC